MKRKNASLFSSLSVFAVVTFLIIATVSCAKKQSPDDYRQQIDAWHQKRIERLKKPDSWFSLAGLYWLKQGENTFGSGKDNDIVFPEGKAPAHIGKIILTGEQAEADIAPDVPVTCDGQPVKRIALKNDQQGKPTILHLGTLSWYVIKRGKQFGIRLKDSENPPLKHFTGIERFPVDRTWRIKARYVPYATPKQVDIPTVLGTVVKEKAPGQLRFEYQGKTYHLEALDDGDAFFVIFGDATNGKESYHAGRFLVVDKPDEQGVTYIDFNKAYNPPCAFTPYATCPLPPRENILPFAVTAGEKDYGHHQR